MPLSDCPHFVGAVYELNQKNMQKLIKQLEEAQEEIKRLENTHCPYCECEDSG